MVLRKFLGPTDLFRAQTFCIHKITKIVVICKDKYLVFATFEIVMLCFESFDNSQKLTVMVLVQNFYKNYFPKKRLLDAISPNQS